MRIERHSDAYRYLKGFIVCPEEMIRDLQAIVEDATLRGWQPALPKDAFVTMEVKAKNAEETPVFAVLTQDPRFDPAKPATINGFPFAPLSWTPSARTYSAEQRQAAMKALYVHRDSALSDAVAAVAKALGLQPSD